MHNQENQEKRLIAFIDGFNYYSPLNKDEIMHKYKWLDYYKLVENLKKPEYIIKDIYYFTATNYNNNELDKKDRHKLYIKALETRNIKVIEGVFKPNSIYKKCPECDCNVRFYKFNEKQTDVNIAVHLLTLINEYDVAMVFSNDTDLIPAYKIIQNTYNKELVIVFPYNEKCYELDNIASSTIKTKCKKLWKSLFPIEVESNSGGILKCPTQWDYSILNKQ